MCGITGLFRASDRAPIPEPESAALQRMNDAITHRGPDEDGFWTGEGVGLAMRRLSIIDVAASHQPQWGPSGQTVVVFNGEIYNYRDVRRELEGLGHTFRTDGDTEVLPHAYEQWGVEGMLRRLNGMFAFALYDARDSSLYLCRDRLGIKPLHYGEFGGTWVFGSELKSLVLHPNVDRRVDPDSLARYLMLEYVPSPRSIYRGIRKVTPGCYVKLDESGATEFRYWALTWTRDRDGWEHPEVPLPPPGHDSLAEWRGPLLHALREAVRARLVSEVPIGALLSGGVDSSATSALMAELVPDLRTFSIEFEEESFDESPFSRAVAEHIGSRHTSRVFTKDRFTDILDAVRGFVDEPFADASILPTHFLSTMVKEEGVTVVLSGDGADELFAGYPTYFAGVVAKKVRRLPGSRRLLQAALRASDHLPSDYGNVSTDYKIRRFLAGATRPPVQRHATFLGAFLEDEMLAVLAPDVRRHLAGEGIWTELQQIHDHAVEHGACATEALTAMDLRTYMGDDILVKVDRASMATSLEVRVPFLDHRVVEMAARIPFGLKLRGQVGKHVLKDAIRDRLPEGITTRSKKGFGMPVAHWLKGPWRELLLDTLGNGRAAATGWFDQAAVDALIDDHLSGRRDRRKPLWTLLMFRWWEEGRWGPSGG
jgi:asparagine synthase (glutamine-hydrolysing)